MKLGDQCSKFFFAVSTKLPLSESVRDFILRLLLRSCNNSHLAYIQRLRSCNQNHKTFRLIAISRDVNLNTRPSSTRARHPVLLTIQVSYYMPPNILDFESMVWPLLCSNQVGNRVDTSFCVCLPSSTPNLNSSMVSSPSGQSIRACQRLGVLTVQKLSRYSPGRNSRDHQNRCQDPRM